MAIIEYHQLSRIDHNLRNTTGIPPRIAFTSSQTDFWLLIKH